MRVRLYNALWEVQYFLRCHRTWTTTYFHHCHRFRLHRGKHRDRWGREVERASMRVRLYNAWGTVQYFFCCHRTWTTTYQYKTISGTRDGSHFHHCHRLRLHRGPHRDGNGWERAR